MLATAVLGVLIALGFGYGLKTVYNNFFKGEAACCQSECCGGGADCPHCKARKAAQHSTT